ncbi:unnamed protein product [Porites lobata]|uniref:YqaJ viral recombinase domain-containing protein n=1 Tax=Porites lobata TaxID=104759 RepID=A0ABN8PYE1_9CNID|nr:unnamed protein product [Porites lobata]
MEYPDLVSYLALQTSWITGQQMKAYKSMDAYNFFVSGWVNIIFTKPVAGTDKVMICYPGAHRFSNATTKWGISNESKAGEAYEFSIADQHLNLSVVDSELHINENWPVLGASPDGLVFCECCGKGLFEIKCPYMCKEMPSWLLAIRFYKKGVLPEILGQGYTRSSAQPRLTESPSTESDEDGPWCFCQQHIEDSRLIGCDKAGCKIQWFHMSCVGLT